MKKLKFFAAMLVIVVMTLAAVACVTTPTLESIEIKSGTVATNVLLGETLDTSNIIVIAHYDDGSEKEISGTDLTVGSFSTDEVGEKTLTVTYQDKTAEITITVSNPTLESIEIKSGTVATQVEQGATLDTNEIIVIAHYEGGAQREIPATSLSIGSFSTDEVGEKTLTVTYQGKTAEITITVTEPYDPNSEIEIISVSLPDFIRDYNNNISEQTNKQEEFFVRDDGYYVGDDNAFAFKPTVVAEDGDGFPINVNESLLDIEAQVEVYQDSEYAPVSEDGDYVEVLGYGSFKFKDEAIGKRIKLTLKPFIKGYPENASRTVSFEFAVVDGWNAYSATDLAMIEFDRYAIKANDEATQRAAAWDAFKTANGLPTTVKTSAVILHNDIAITASDIPSVFFYKDGDDDLNAGDSDYARTKDSLRDSVDVYFRGVLPDENFDLIGNYFTVDASAIPFVTRENGKITDVGEVISHATLIKLHGKNKDVASGHTEGTAMMKNMYIIGNSQRTETPEASGGLIFHKIRDVDFTIGNVISRRWFITFFTECVENDVTEYTVENCKAYDSFNSFMYVWGGENVTVKDSEMIGAGGPVMIVDHTYPTNEDGGYPSSVAVSNSKLESVVSGEEGWFNLVGATGLIPTIKAADQLFRAYGRTYLRNASGSTTLTSGEATYFNFIAVIKSGEAEGLSFDPIRGNVNIDNNAPLNFGNGTDPASMLAKLHLDALLMQGGGAPVFQSSVGGVGFTDGTGMYQLNASTYAQEMITDPTNALFQGDYLNFYFTSPGASGYMAAMMGYYPVAAA